MFQIFYKQSFMLNLHMVFYGNDGISCVVCNQTFVTLHA